MVIVEMMPAGLDGEYGGGAGAEDTGPLGAEGLYGGGTTDPEGLLIGVEIGQMVVETGLEVTVVIGWVLYGQLVTVSAHSEMVKVSVE
jgi:hypothetical protein